MSTQPVVLGVAVLCLIVGAGVFIYTSTSKRTTSIQGANLIAWLLIALFPVLVIFSFFPDSSLSIGTKSLSAGGAIAAFILIWRHGTRAGLKAINDDHFLQTIRDRDEVVAALTKDLEVARAVTSPKPLHETQIYAYRCKGLSGREFGLITGNLSKIVTVDVWVNSENTNLQMASFFDRSISGYIRYAGALKDALGNVTDDVVGKAVAEALHGHLSVAPGTVIKTESGDLSRTHRVQLLVHSAAVQGQAGQGYKQIQNVGSCVENTLALVDHHNAESGRDLKSIVFPLMGTGQGRGEVESTMRTLLAAAIDYLQARRSSSIRAVYFLAYTDFELGACLGVFDEFAGMQSVGVRAQRP